ncbi:MAG: hypothetical protein ACRECY_01130 [Phyllobacterium sp.]
MFQGGDLAILRHYHPMGLMRSTCSNTTLMRKKPLSRIGRFLALTPGQAWQMRAQFAAFAAALYFAIRPVSWLDFLWPYSGLLFVFYWGNRLLWRLYAIWKNGKLRALNFYLAGKRASEAARLVKEP